MPALVGVFQLGRAKLTGDAVAARDASTMLKLIGMGADTYTATVWALRGFYSMANPYKQAQEFPLTVAPLDIKESSHEVDADLAFIYGANDFDWPERRMTPKALRIYNFMEWLSPPRLEHRYFKSRDEYRRMLTDDFKGTFKAMRELDGLDPAAPSTVVKYFTHDFGAPLLTKEGDRFVVDLSHWEPLQLEAPEYFEPYGGRLSFDAALGDVQIAYRGKTYTPEDAQWDRVRYTVMSTALMAVVVANHTIHVHMLNAALVSVKTRVILPVDHPIYRFLRPFTIKTVAINEHARFSILGRSGILNHGMAIEYEELKKLYKRAAAEYRHRPLPEIFARDGLKELAAGDCERDFPYVYEGGQVWGIIERFVEAYVGLYFADDAAVQGDAKLVRWYEEIRKGMPATAGLDAALTRKGLVDFVATFVWNVTFYHDLTSQTGNSLADYHLGASAIRRVDKCGTFYPNVQEQFVTLLAHQLTTIESVKLTDNYHLWWLDGRARDAALKFQQELWQYHDALAARNARRDLTYNSMDPVFIETSVQT
jgi:hypothetical protein